MVQEKILIVEDDSLIAAYIEDVLVKSGYTVVGMVSTGESAVMMADQIPLDLILMDIVLKGVMDGITTAKKILTRVDIPIIYLTAYAEEELLNRAKETIPYGYLTKPVDERELIATITMALTRHAHDKRLKESETQCRTVIRDVLHQAIGEGSNGEKELKRKTGPVRPQDRKAS